MQPPLGARLVLKKKNPPTPLPDAQREAPGVYLPYSIRGVPETLDHRDNCYHKHIQRQGGAGAGEGAFDPPPFTLSLWLGRQVGRRDPRRSASGFTVVGGGGATVYRASLLTFHLYIVVLMLVLRGFRRKISNFVLVFPHRLVAQHKSDKPNESHNILLCPSTGSGPSTS